MSTVLTYSAILTGNLLSDWAKARLEGFQREWEERNVESASEKRTVHVSIGKVMLW